MAYQNPRAGEPLRRPGQLNDPTARSASFGNRVHSEDSWVEISSQPSSSSLSSLGDEVVTTGLRVQHDPRQQQRRRRTLRPSAPSGLNISTTTSATRPSSSEGGLSSQEEYEESESESDRVMTSSGEGAGPHPLADAFPSSASSNPPQESSSDDDENRTAINHPLRQTNDTCFTPQPNAFTHPPSTTHIRNASVSHPPHQPVAGSYFPSQQTASRPQTRQQHHLPQNILSPSYNAAAQHEEALRASLSTLLSCAAAARGLPGKDKQRTQQRAPPAQSRVEPMSFRLVPESALPVASPAQHRTQSFQEPVFKPTLRRTSTSTTNSAPALPSPAPRTNPHKDTKRKSRPASKDRVHKKPRHSSISSEDLGPSISPTLLTWVLSAGVVVVFSALSFSAGFSMGKEAGRLEGGVGFERGDEVVRGCAREAGRSSLGLRRGLTGGGVQV